MKSNEHELRNRTLEEVTWYKRRGFIQTASVLMLAGGSSSLLAAGRSNIVQLEGAVQVNRKRIGAEHRIVLGDVVQTDSNSHVVFTIGNSAFLVRQNSVLEIEAGVTQWAVGVLRLVTGALASVWGKGERRQIVTKHAVAGIRGTGAYTEVLPDDRTYFCNCYGTIELEAGDNMDRKITVAQHHDPFIIGSKADANGDYILPAGAFNHTDEELEYLASLVDQKTAWQLYGKLKHDGHGASNGIDDDVYGGSNGGGGGY